VSNSRVRGLLAVAVVVALVSLPGCSKSAITITLTATPAGGSAVTCTTGSTSTCSVTVNQGQTVDLAATVANDKTNSGVNWSLGTSIGSLSSQTTTAATYVAPSALTASTTATVTATSVANSSVTENVSVTVNAVFEFETSSLPVATQDVAYSATISTIGATGPFTWIILSGNLPAGLQLSNSNTASVNITGTPTTVGSSTVTIQATDGTGTPIQRTFTLTVNPPPALTIISPATITPGTVGQAYSYTLQAEFGTPPYAWSLTGTGSLPNGIQLKNGVLTGTPTTAGTSTFGVQVQDSATPNPGTATKNLTLTINQVSANQDLTGNYAFLVSGFDPSGNRFAAAGSFQASTCAISNGTIDTNDGGTVQSLPGLSGNCSIDATGLGTLNFGGRRFAMSFVPTSNSTAIASANLIEFDNADQASGVLLLQNTGSFATPSGSYAFGFLGADASSHRYALAGAFSTGGAGVFDSDDGGALQTNQPFTVSALNAPDTSTGRGTLAFSVSGTATNYAYYVVDASRVLVMEIDQGTVPVVAGTILAQSGSLGASSFTDAVFETTASSSGTALTQLGVMTTDGASVLNTSFDKSSGGTTQSSSGTYSVDSTTGRTTLTSSGLAAAQPVVYLAQANEGFIVGTDAAVTFGFTKAQTPGSAVSGTYAGGSIPAALSGPSGAVKAAGANAGALALLYDASTSGGLLQDQSVTTGYSAASGNGRGTITSMPPANSQAIYYIVSPTEFWTLTPSANGPIEIFQAPGATGLFQQ